MRIRNLTSVASLLALLLLSACADTPEVGSDHDPRANFASYRTFALMPRNRVLISLPPDAMHNPLVISRVEDEIKQQLQGKGFTLTDPMRADFIVDFTIGAAERIDVHSYRGGLGGGPPWAGGPWRNDIDVRQYREGTLAIDVFDVHDRRPVWHGWAQKELTREEMKQSAAPIRDAVRSVLAKFPPAA